MAKVVNCFDRAKEMITFVSCNQIVDDDEKDIVIFIIAVPAHDVVRPGQTHSLLCQL